ncbi:insulin-induced protein-domain-containing protein [Dendryphion nanum]|uniref:Insulin-induced protein-domain-containing protein n=1 Tax=Dendryphion nanum TaxID=256645 RepID=A0A9P9IUZ1_9PLEO|nr:insulin-induced protein-domain-containing protein [Dendryphion nanum]
MTENPFVSTSQQPHIYRPIPRRNFSHSDPQSQSSESPDPIPQNTPPTLQDSSNRSSDFLAQLNARLLRTNNYRNGSAQETGYSQENGQPTRNKSYLNMTSSTLYGIYDDVGSSTAGDQSVADTPWGAGAETPARHYSMDSAYSSSVNGFEIGMGSPDGGLNMTGRARRGNSGAQKPHPRSRHASKPHRHGVWKAAVIIGKLSALFLFGVVYGITISHLYDTKELAAVKVGGVNRDSWLYIASWGLAGIILGGLLPYMDLVCHEENDDGQIRVTETDKESESTLGEQWNEIIRSVGAFVGIAFAIRRLPWQSSLQLTFTLALVNPALWYILDRSKLGFSFSLITTSVVTSLILFSNPDVLPSPALLATANSTHSLASARTGAQAHEGLFAGMISYDTLATVTWVGSVIFCSCVCFGGIGRRLAILDDWERKR